MTDQILEFPKDLRKKLLIYNVAVLIINVFLTIIEPTGSVTDLAGEIASGWELKKSMFVTLTIGFIIISCILALLVSLIPFKNLKYGQKYTPSIFVSYFGLQLLYLFFEIRYLFQS